jgi:tetratricopeptide (TPR) repeat protein
MRQKCMIVHLVKRQALLGGALCCLTAGLGRASGTEPAAPPSVYQQASHQYFLDRSLDFAEELLLKESHLRELYDCTGEEIKARRSEGLDGKLLDHPLWEIKAAAFNPENDSALAEASIGKRYRLWVDYENSEYQRRLGRVQQAREQLIKTGAEAQNQRMFQCELRRALYFYGKKEWDLARLLFDRLLEDYRYQQVDDILYYQAQTCLQMRLLDPALDALQQLIAACPNSSYRARSYDLATAILEAFGGGYQTRKLYSKYLEEGFPGDPAVMGGVHVRAARAEIVLGHYEPAVEILARVSDKSPYYLASQYLLADCYTALENWPEAVRVLTAMVEVKQRNMPFQRWRMLKDEARLKLAFIYYQWGDYQTAANLFDQMKANSPFYDRVLMGKSWIAFQLEDYDAAISKTEDMLQAYPLSTEIYEANSLAGYCCEQLGKDDEATAHFLQVLDAGAGRSDLSSFLEERRRLSEAMADLQAQEEKVFASGDEKLFSDYRRARNQLWGCQQRIKLAELLQVNSRMRVLVEERAAMDSLIREQKHLERQVSASGDHRLVAQFLSIEDRIWASMDRLKLLGQEQAKSTPLYYKEAQVGYINVRADSLASRLEAEIKQLSQAQKSAQELQRAALATNNIDGYLKLGLRLDRLDQTLDQTGQDRSLAENNRRPVLRTRVDRWSDFSFNRYAMGGMNLEQLDRKYERLRQLDEFLATLDEMIAQKTLKR